MQERHQSDLVDRSVQGQEEGEASSVTRRAFLQTGALAGGAALTPFASSAQETEAASTDHVNHHDSEIAGASIARLQSLMASGQLSSKELLDIYLRRIRAIDKGLDLRSIIQLNPDARRIATQLDHERRSQRPAWTAAWHSDSSEGQHRHGRPSADDCRLAGARRRTSSAGRDCHGAASRRWGSDSGQGELERMGELPRIRKLERLERSGPAMSQPAHSRPQSLRIELRVGSGRRGRIDRSCPRDGNGRLDRLSGRSMRCRRHQADRRV